MDKETQDKGIAAVIVERMQEQRLPRALDLKAKVDGGGILDDLDIEAAVVAEPLQHIEAAASSLTF